MKEVFSITLLIIIILLLMFITIKSINSTPVTSSLYKKTENNILWVKIIAFSIAIIISFIGGYLYK